ncbi:MAG: hypothetical protein JKY22_04805, partial [Flavobacteriaceae bacterium]|nr:hypothetical protein [Flavobacteriaceae bacterium]
MKKVIYLFTLLLVFSLNSQAQEFPQPNPSKVSSLDNTIKTLYAVISGEKGEERDWDLMRYLFHPDAKLIPSEKSKSGIYKARFMTVENYIQGSGRFLVDNGFFEKEIHRTEQTFGNITHIFSTYHSF